MSAIQESKQMYLEGPFPYIVDGPNMDMLAGTDWHSFLDGHSSYNHISIALEDK